MEEDGNERISLHKFACVFLREIEKNIHVFLYVFINMTNPEHTRKSTWTCSYKNIVCRYLLYI